MPNVDIHTVTSFDIATQILMTYVNVREIQETPLWVLLEIHSM